MYQDLQTYQSVRYYTRPDISLFGTGPKLNGFSKEALQILSGPLAVPPGSGLSPKAHAGT
jgi:hypothetical protein